MSFVIQLVQGRSVKLTQVKTPILRIGRGTNADIRSENPAVAFEHAIVEQDEGGYNITDKGSITGTYVNGKPVDTQRLGKGDVIEAGDLRIEVQVAEAKKPLFLKMVSLRKPDTGVGQPAEEIGEDTGTRYAAEAGVGQLGAKKTDFVDAYQLKRPYLNKLTVASILLIVALGVVGEVTRPEKQDVFMPGGVSSAHARARDPFDPNVNIAQRCNACHEPWKSISDSKCSRCHGATAAVDKTVPHARFQSVGPLCYSCHAEHRGLAKLSEMPDARCNECHRNLDQHTRATQSALQKVKFGPGNRYSYADIKSITNFGGTHPEFVFPADNNNLRFNHKRHFAVDRALREKLECKSCHVMGRVTGGKIEPQPIRFEDHCERCHQMTFGVSGGPKVPHGGDPNNIFALAAAAVSGQDFSSLAGLSRDERQRAVEQIVKRASVSSGGQIAERIANGIILGQAGCSKCHEVKKQGDKFTIEKAHIGRRWFERAEYTHTPEDHQRDCESCHAKARMSTLTSDVLMPARANCTDCHSAARIGRSSQGPSNCVTCHHYHPPTKVKAPVVAAGVGGVGAIPPAGSLLDPISGGDMLQTILFAAIVILLFVVLVPLGAALYQRMKAPKQKAAVPTAVKAPAMGAPPMAPSAPAEPPMRASAPRAEAAPTQMINLEELKKPEGPAPGGATEMLQWYGMLRCTAGPLEGQNFIIEDNGFYIGRDSTMSKVVINDGRISKRHVRIQPRNGKVFAIDEGSTNGTFLGQGGQRITEHQLKRGDTLVLADNAATFVYQI